MAENIKERFGESNKSLEVPLILNNARTGIFASISRSSVRGDERIYRWGVGLFDVTCVACKWIVDVKSKFVLLGQYECGRLPLMYNIKLTIVHFMEEVL